MPLQTEIIGNSLLHDTNDKHTQLRSNNTNLMAKKEKIQEIFNDIAPDYDRLNHILSLNIDKKWRKKAIKYLSNRTEHSGVSAKVEKLLDVACGTGDFSIVAAQSGITEVIGVDISEKMIEVGNKKIRSKKLDNRVFLQYGDSEQLNFLSKSFDAVTVAFGVRNFENLEIGLREMHRVLKDNGSLVILEFSMPEHFPVKQLYRFYFNKILPFVGGLFSGNKKAYGYLPQSVSKFPQGEEFIRILEDCGFVCTQKKLTFGIASMYAGWKKHADHKI